MDNGAGSSIAILVIVIAFIWIGCAYAMGTESERMILHPIVPILLIPLLLGFRNDESVRRVIIVAIVLISIWLFARLQSVFLPFVIGFSLAYVLNAALTGLQNIPIPLPKDRKFYLPKGASVAILLILLIGVMTFFALGIVPQLVEQASAMKDGITNFYARTKDYTMKKCSHCKSFKDESKFHNDKSTIDGLSKWCKKCKRDESIARGRTLNGCISNIYTRQNSSSKKRNHSMPTYSKDEFHKWVMEQDNV